MDLEKAVLATLILGPDTSPFGEGEDRKLRGII